MNEFDESACSHSFDDSERFDDESICSTSDLDVTSTHWRGWRRSSESIGESSKDVQKFDSTCDLNRSVVVVNGEKKVLSLAENAARVFASHLPFEFIEKSSDPIPGEVQLRIAFWSFPSNEEDIRLYSCLTNGNSDEFTKGENLFKQDCVSDLLQIGFHLSANVNNNVLRDRQESRGPFNVAVSFDRRKITVCHCTCRSPASWCSHVVAVCLFRIHKPHEVTLRAPLSESLNHLSRDDLQKFAQYLISQLPHHFLSSTQKLLDDILSTEVNDINSVRGAPDPTAGACLKEITTWCLDKSLLQENVHKSLGRQCLPMPIVFGDVAMLSSNAPPVASEFMSLLRPLRGRQPEGMWNLLEMVREMFRRADSNAVPLLEILTDEIFTLEQIIAWWFSTKTNIGQNHCNNSQTGNKSQNIVSNQYACSGICDEIVIIWRLACLNPVLNNDDKMKFFERLKEWHSKTIHTVIKQRPTNEKPSAKRFDLFQGFRYAMEACLLDWADYPIPGVTYCENYSQRWLRALCGPVDIKKSLAENCGSITTTDQGESSSRERSSFSSDASKRTEDEDESKNKSIIEGISNLKIGYKSEEIIIKSLDGNSNLTRFVVKPIEDPSEKLYARADALYMHGYFKDASILAVKLCDQLLSTPITLLDENSKHPQNITHKKRRFNPSNHFITLKANSTMSKAIFLCDILGQRKETQHLAFRAGLFGLELARSPASTKSLEVKLFNQENELLSALKRIPLFEPELEILREKACLMRSGDYSVRGGYLLPLTLASYLFEALVCSVPAGSSSSPSSSSSSSSKSIGIQVTGRNNLDLTLGFEAAVGALGMKANVAEADNPLLCEGTRRQRGELALQLLVHYKNDKCKLDKIMEQLLNDDIHQLQNIDRFITDKNNGENNNNNNKFNNNNNCPGNKKSSPKNIPINNSPNCNLNRPGNPSSEWLNLMTDKTRFETLATMQSEFDVWDERRKIERIPWLTTLNNQPHGKKKYNNRVKIIFPNIPNMPSEAASHFLFELAKSILEKAGGSVNVASFQSSGGNHRTNSGSRLPHRRLQFCAFRIGLHALGVQNAVTTNWQTRTYSTTGTWIQNQAQEIGAPALEYLVDNWSGHLTPSEVASLADRASNCPDTSTVRVASRLALSCLYHANELNQNEIHRALMQCREHSNQMLVEACIAVETAGKNGGVHPSVLFSVAKIWDDLSTDTQNDEKEANNKHRLAENLFNVTPSQSPQQSPQQQNTPSRPLVFDQNSMQIQQQVTPQRPMVYEQSVSIQQQVTPPRQVVFDQNGVQIQQQVTPPRQIVYDQNVMQVQQQQMNPQRPVVYEQSLSIQQQVTPQRHVVFDQNLMQVQQQHSNPQRPVVYDPNVVQIQQQQVTQPRPVVFDSAGVVQIQQQQTSSPQQVIYDMQVQQTVTYAVNGNASFSLPNFHLPNLYGFPQSPILSPYIPGASPSSLQRSSVPTSMHNVYQYHSPPALVPCVMPMVMQPAHRYQIVNTCNGQTYGTLPIAGISSSKAQLQGQNVNINSANSRSPKMLNNSNYQQLHADNGLPQALTPKEYNCLQSAFRVATLALEIAVKRSNEDKTMRSLKLDDEIKWFLGISKRLGYNFVQRFCLCIEKSSQNPFVLYDVLFECISYLKKLNSPAIPSPEKSPFITPLIVKCQDLLVVHIHQKLHNITPSEYEDFVNAVRLTRNIYQFENNPRERPFKDVLSVIKKSRSCTRELWQMLTTTLHITHEQQHHICSS